jgi:hypothetical protein
MSVLGLFSPKRGSINSGTEGEGQGDHVLYCEGSLKVLVVPNAMAELLSCKLLPILAAGMKQLYFT